MANYPVSIFSGTPPSGTSLVTNPDHADLHAGDQAEIRATQLVLGTTAGTSVLKNYNAGDFAVRSSSSGVLRQAIRGTLNPNSLIESSTFHEGTVDAGTITNTLFSGGTVSAFFNGTATGAFIGTSQITGGTANINNINSDGQNNITLTPGTVSHVKLQILRQNDGTNTYDTGEVIMTGYGVITVSGTPTGVTGTVSFGTAFSAIPIIVLTGAGAGPAIGTTAVYKEIVATTFNHNAGSFCVQLERYSGNMADGQKIRFDWMALGKL